MLNFELIIIDVEVGKGATRQDRAYRFTGTKAAQFKEAYINAFNQMEKQLNEQKHLPATTPNTVTLETSFQETEKYQVLNDMVKAMHIQSDPVVLPSKEVVEMVQAIRMYQQQIARLQTPDWINDNVDHIKEYTNRTFLDDWPMPKHK